MVARGTHPNSLANLRPAWSSETKPNPTGERGPIVTPAMRRYSAWSFEQLIELAHDEKRASKLPMADVIAITTLIKAAKDVPWGDKSRELVMNRLDGEAVKGVEVDVGVRVIVRQVEGAERELG